ncbi:hypothetical protein NSMS1_16160 [Nostoc sp. MS1]|nr:hypothetical protein NSMS1_16160 [Nostoc sp. MS1]
MPVNKPIGILNTEPIATTVIVPKMALPKPLSITALTNICGFKPTSPRLIISQIIENKGIIAKAENAKARAFIK